MLALTNPYLLSSGSTVCNVHTSRLPSLCWFSYVGWQNIFDIVHSYNDVDGYDTRASLSTDSLGIVYKKLKEISL